METSRYWAGIIIGVILGVGGACFAWASYRESIVMLAIGAYAILSTAASLIWWCGPPAKVFAFVSLVIGWAPLDMAFGLISSGETFGAIVGIILFCVLAPFCLSCFAFGFMLAAVVSIFTFPFLVVPYSQDLY